MTGLLIVGHGSTVNPDSSAPTWAQAEVIKERGIFREVNCAFWKEEPSLRDARFLFDSEVVRDVFVVPNFISEGYFTQTVIPRELELGGDLTVRPGGQRWHYCEPVGNHPAMTDLLLKRAEEVSPGMDPRMTALFIVGHGTALNDQSAVAAKREAERLRGRGIFAEVLNAYMEEPPLIAEWDQLTTQPNVIVVPFFIADGLHSFEDIPALLGIDPAKVGAPEHGERGEIFRQNPHRLRGRTVAYASSIGTEARFADAIIEQARNARSVAHAG